MLEFIVTNATGILLVITSAIALASAIANLTPTDADNKVIAKISSFVDMIALNWVKKK